MYLLHAAQPVSLLDAVQGHSVALEAPVIEPLLNWEQVPLVSRGGRQGGRGEGRGRPLLNWEQVPLVSPERGAVGGEGAGQGHFPNTGQVLAMFDPLPLHPGDPRDRH